MLLTAEQVEEMLHWCALKKRALVAESRVKSARSRTQFKTPEMVVALQVQQTKLRDMFYFRFAVEMEEMEEAAQHYHLTTNSQL